MVNDNQTYILLTRFFSGEAAPEEAMQVEDWANLSPANRSYLNSCAAFFSSLGDEHLTDGKQRVWDNIQESALKKDAARKLISRRWLSIAASIIMIPLIGLLINHVFKKKSDEMTYQAGTSAKKIALKDSSEIILLPHSSIILNKDYGANNRRIKLKGSANFSVIHDASREFIVDADRLYIKDIGTSFNVLSSQTDDTVLINVIQGEISIYDDIGSSANANAGEKWTYIRSRKRLQILPEKQFKDTLLQDAIVKTKPAKVKAETKTPDTVIKNDDHPQESVKDSSENYPYGSHPRLYPLDRRYTAEGKYARRVKDSVETARMMADLMRDGLVIGGQPLSFKLSDTAFIINDKKQSDPLFQRYRKKYVPAGKAGEGWVWSHYANQPAKQR